MTGESSATGCFFLLYYYYCYYIDLQKSALCGPLLKAATSLWALVEGQRLWECFVLSVLCLPRTQEKHVIDPKGEASNRNHIVPPIL